MFRVGRPKHKLLHLYTLHNKKLSETDSAKYLGVTIYITSDLQWNQHINNIYSQQSKQHTWPSTQKPQNSLSDH